MHSIKSFAAHPTSFTSHSHSAKSFHISKNAKYISTFSKGMPGSTVSFVKNIKNYQKFQNLPKNSMDNGWKFTRKFATMEHGHYNAPPLTQRYEVLAQDLQKRTQRARIGYWTAFAGLTMVGTGAAELAMEYLGAPPMSGLAFLGATGGTALFQIIMYRFMGGGKKVAKSMGGILANPNDPKQAELVQTVQQLVAAAKLPAMPAVYLIPTPERNAFAAGFKPDDTVIAVTQGLMNTLDKNELKAVLGHEVGHLASGDSTTALHLAAINMGFYAVLRLGYSMFNSARRQQHAQGGRSKQHPESAKVAALALMAVGGVTWLVGQLYRLFISRSRELVADACSVAYVGNNKDLASALLKISKQPASVTGPISDNKHVYSHMYIESPPDTTAHFLPKGLAQWFSTHPSTEERLEKLRMLNEDYLKQLQVPFKALPSSSTKSTVRTY